MSAFPTMGRDWGLRQALAIKVKLEVRHLMVEILGDRILHAEAVATGPFAWRAAFVKDMGSYFGNQRAPCDTLADLVYQFFVGTWRHRYPEMSPQQFLNAVNPISPPTPAEIEDAWEVEIGSSDAAMRSMYEGSARHRKGRDLGERKTKLEN